MRLIDADELMERIDGYAQKRKTIDVIDAMKLIAEVEGKEICTFCGVTTVPFTMYGEVTNKEAMDYAINSLLKDLACEIRNQANCSHEICTDIDLAKVKLEIGLAKPIKKKDINVDLRELHMALEAIHSARHLGGQK